MQLTTALSGAMHMSQSIRDRAGVADIISLEEHVIPVLSESLEIEIELHQSDWTPQHVKGSLKRFPDRAVIYYPSSFNHCNRRFVVAKELAHLIDTWGEDVDTNTVQGAVDLVSYITNPVTVSDDANQQLSRIIGAEESAELYALELLLPDAQRQQIALEGLGLRQTAERYKVPVSKVELYLHPKYAEFMRLTRRLVDNSVPTPLDLSLIHI